MERVLRSQHSVPRNFCALGDSCGYDIPQRPMCYVRSWPYVLDFDDDAKDSESRAKALIRLRPEGNEGGYDIALSPILYS